MMEEIPLAGLRVLYVAPRFFGYDEDIAGEMRRRGAEVVRLFDRPFATPAMTAVTKLAPGAIARAALPLYRRTLGAEAAPLDLVFVVNGQTLPGAFLDEVRRHSPQATFILYLWDALSNRGSIVPQLGRYDHVFGFDRTDAARYGFTYRPLFFTPVFDEASTEDERYDISFIGTAHTDRAPIVRAIDETLPPEIARFWYLFLQAPWVRRYYAARSAAFRRVPAAMFHYDSMPKETIGRVFRQSRAILDIEHPLQRGLTMRTFETLGAGKKLITTNPHVRQEDFYDPVNVLVVDRSRVAVPPGFFQQPFTAPPAAIRRRYALAGWLDEILAGSGIAAQPVRDLA
jgi:hypothetical protein